MATPMTISVIPTSHARIWGATRTATPNIMNINAGITSTGPDIGLSIIPLHVFAIGHIGVEIDPVMSSSISGAQARSQYADDDRTQIGNDRLG